MPQFNAKKPQALILRTLQCPQKVIFIFLFSKMASIIIHTLFPNIYTYKEIIKGFYARRRLLNSGILFFNCKHLASWILIRAFFKLEFIRLKEEKMWAILSKRIERMKFCIHCNVACVRQSKADSICYKIDPLVERDENKESKNDWKSYRPTPDRLLVFPAFLNARTGDGLTGFALD